jgi:OOP family OmpA-OmpF porin
MKITIQSLALATLVAALSGGAATASRAADPAVANDAASFPEPGRAWLAGGSFVNVEQLRRIGPGMSKDQIRELISYPHFGEGLFAVRTWNYLFNFRTGRGSEFVTCQYQVQFNGQRLAERMFWRNPSCAQYLNPSEVRVAAVLPPPPAPRPPQKITLGADGLFRFDGSTLADLLPEGQRRIETLADDINRRAQQSVITVTGHTDRLGSDAYNDALSLARATTVRNLLVQHGVDSRAVSVSGMGKRKPLVECTGSRATPELVHCLQPNRRVEITVATQSSLL